MLVTEEEAREKWCPEARVPGSLRTVSDDEPVWAGTQNRGHTTGGPLHNCCCIGSACMAWRAGVYEHQRNLAPQDRTPNVGYCGLAGSVS